MYRAAVIGDRDSIYGFAALGLDVVPADHPEEAAAALSRLSKSGYAVIYITEAMATALEAEIGRRREQRLPAIIPIPGISGNTGIGMESVRRSVEKAVGSDILAGGDGREHE